MFLEFIYFLFESRFEDFHDGNELISLLFLEDFFKVQRYQMTYLEEMAVIASCNVITAEYRFFVVEKEVITGSMYRFAGEGNLSSVVPDNMIVR